MDIDGILQAMSEIFRNPKGTIDYLFASARLKADVIEHVTQIFRGYGYQPIDTPAIENVEVLEKGYRGHEEQTMFRVMARGDELERRLDVMLGDEHKKPESLADLALRYDLTIPLSRIIEQYRNQITFPLKRYQIATVWRTERPSSGRHREFTICDADTIGSTSLLDDAESIDIVLSVFDSLGLQPLMRINNRKILQGIIDIAGVNPENALEFVRSLSSMRQSTTPTTSGLTSEISSLLMVIQPNDQGVAMETLKKSMGKSEVGLKGVSELGEVLKYLGSRKSRVIIDTTLSRGAGYYTGTIIDTKIASNPGIRSAFNGGRYDGVVGLFSPNRLSAVGVTLSLERLLSGMNSKDEKVTKRYPVDAILMPSDTGNISCMPEVAHALRESGLNIMIYPQVEKDMGKKIKFALSKEARYTITLTGDFQSTRILEIKDLESREVTKVTIEELIEERSKTNTK